MPSTNIPGFVHLRLHSEYSLVDSTVRLESVKPKGDESRVLIPSLFDRARELGMPAVALTDEGNLFAMVKFYSAAEKAGIKPIVGADLWLLEGAGGSPTRLTLLCRNHAGYLNLSRLISRCYTEGQQRGQPMLRREWLTGHADGLIALSGAREGDIGHALLAGRQSQAHESLDQWRRHFPDSF